MAAIDYARAQRPHWRMHQVSSSIENEEMPSFATTAVPRPRCRRTPLTIVVVAGAALVLLLAGALWAVHAYGPRFGLYLAPPSVEQYGEAALSNLEQGYYAAGSEWASARAELRDAAAEAEDYADLHDDIAAATSVAGGSHSTFLTPEEEQRYVTSSAGAFHTPTVRTESGVTTITVPALGSVSSELQQEYAQAAADGIAAAASDTCGWVVDLRGNTGGNMYPMLSGLALLLPNGDALSFRTRTGDLTTVTVQDDGVGIGQTITSVGEQPKIDDALIAVLQSGRTASSGEAVAVAFRGLEGAVSFGAPSAGYTSGNTVINLYDGASIALTTGVFVDRDGVSLNEQPIVPDQPTAAHDADEAAAQWLAEQGCVS